MTIRAFEPNTMADPGSPLLLALPSTPLHSTPLPSPRHRESGCSHSLFRQSFQIVGGQRLCGSTLLIFQEARKHVALIDWLSRHSLSELVLPK